LPYKIGYNTQLLDDGGTAAKPPQQIAAGTFVERHEVKQLPGRLSKIARITTTAAPVLTGWIDEKAIVPVYGQTNKAAGFILEANQETKDLCQRFAKALDEMNLPVHRRGAVLHDRCAAVRGSRRKQALLRLIVRQSQSATGLGGCSGEDRRGAGSLSRERKGAPPKSRRRVVHSSAGGIAVDDRGARRAPPGIQYDQSWDAPYPRTGASLPAIPRKSNLPGACAAQKMVQRAIKKLHTMRYLWEQWYDTTRILQHNVAMDSCPTCKITIARMLRRAG